MSVVSDSVRPHRWQPTRLPRPWDSPGKNIGVVCHFLLQCTKMKSESEVAQSCLTLRDPWTAAYQFPPSMRFPRQEYWSGLPLPSHSISIFQSLSIALVSHLKSSFFYQIFDQNLEKKYTLIFRVLHVFVYFAFL